MIAHFWLPYGRVHHLQLVIRPRQIAPPANAQTRQAPAPSGDCVVRRCRRVQPRSRQRPSRRAHGKIAQPGAQLFASGYCAEQRCLAPVLAVQGLPANRPLRAPMLPPISAGQEERPCCDPQAKAAPLTAASLDSGHRAHRALPASSVTARRAEHCASRRGGRRCTRQHTGRSSSPWRRRGGRPSVPHAWSR